MPEGPSRSRSQRRTPTFRAALETVGPPVSDAYKPGIRALHRRHRTLISLADDQILTGSIDLDAALLDKYPNASRWDYGIGYRQEHGEAAVWVEVHGAQTNKVREMLKKLRWLKDWLNGDGQSLRQLTRPTDAFVWLASGPMRLPRHLPQAKQADQEGIYPKKRLQLP